MFLVIFLCLSSLDFPFLLSMCFFSIYAFFFPYFLLFPATSGSSKCVDKCTHALNVYPALHNPRNNYFEKNGVHSPQQLCGTYELTQLLSCRLPSKQEL